MTITKKHGAKRMHLKIHWKVIGFYLLLMLLMTLIACQNAAVENDESAGELIYPKTEVVLESNYKLIIYVSKSGKDVTGNGLKENPYQSIPFALKQVQNASNENRIAIFIASGEYSGETIQLNEYVDLFGGFKDQTWERDVDKYISILSGGGDGRVIIASNFTILDGFQITGGEFKGKGSALYCDSTSPIVSNNVFSDNKTLAPDNWNPKYWHDTAHDGGAIFGHKGASPTIRNNIFVNNKTENGRGAAISFDGHCKPIIKNNVFLSNTAGLKDPMRSSDGGAINIFNWSKAIIDGNIFISNRAESKNDGGAVFIALWSSAEVMNNLFVDSYAGDDAGALFVGGQEHRYNAALDPIPAKDEFFVSIKNNTFIGNHHGGSNSGAMRFTMESRGEFSGNILAHNNGVYFQRSEVRIADNIILDNFLFIETKEGLEKGIIENNLLWADYDQQVDADVKNNNMLYVVEGNGNYSKTPQFIDDGFEIRSVSTNYKRQNLYTLITTPNLNLKKNQLLNRAVKAGNKWGVIKSNDANTILVWGNFMGDVNFTILPTYTLAN